MQIREKLPKSVFEALRNTRNSVVHLAYSGTQHYCPVCGRSSREFGRYRELEHVKCMACGSMARHRFTWVYFERMTDLFDGKAKDVLHVAPEISIENSLRKRLGPGYLTADLFNPHAMVKMDITDIDRDDESFEVIYCSHVLEHVDDDLAAMREFCRVLKSTGWAVLLVPITAEETYGDPSITDPQERLRLFGQEDHVRRYGPDFADRLRSSGFDVDVVRPADFLSADEIVRMGIDDTEELFLCKKRAA